MGDGILDLAFEVWRKGGFVMWFLAPVTLLMWFGIGVRLFTLRRGFPLLDNKMRSPLAALVERARAGKLQTTWGVVDAGVATAVAVANESRKNLRSRLDEALYPVRDEAGAWATVVTGAAIAAPLAGLLGTVTGMIETFESLNAGAMFTAGGGGVGAGISEALVSTQTGLVVAVPGILLGALLLRKQRQLEDELDQLVEMLCAERGEA